MMSNFELLPRSIIRTFQRFFKQVRQTDVFAIYEFRVSRYIAIASLQCVLFLIVCPWIFYFCIKFFLIHPLLETQFFDPTQIFFNFSQQERAFSEIQTFSQQIYFETLLKSGTDSFSRSSTELQQVYQTYFLKCANFYHQQSVSIITNWILDLTTILFFIVLLFFSTPQIVILKTFFIESLLSLSETTKCFFLIFFLDLLVGFHSSKSWEIFLYYLIEHFGFQIQQNQNFIYFFISTFPVLLDTIFKYWIFRYLNKISPSTVATYQAMIE